MISNELFERVILNSNRDKLIDKELIRMIAIEQIEHSDHMTKLLFDDIVFEENDWDFAAATSYIKYGLINVNYNNLVTYINRLNLTTEQANLLTLQVILHEIEHLKEPYKISKDNFESKIIKIGGSDYIENKFKEEAELKFFSRSKKEEYVNTKFREFYEKYYKIIPTERIAEIESVKVLINTMKNYPDFCINNKEIYHYILEKYFDFLIRGYVLNRETNKYNIPFLTYLKGIKYNGLLDDLGFHLIKRNENGFESSIEKRMKYGFSITQFPQTETNKQKILTKDTK